MFILQSVLHPFEGKQNADALGENEFVPATLGFNTVCGVMRHLKVTRLNLAVRLQSPPTPVITIQREPVSAVSSDINFPMKGRRGMKDWARTAEDKLFIPKEVFTSPAEGGRTSVSV